MTETVLSVIAILISFSTLLFTYFKLVNELSQRLTRVETKLEMIEKKLGNDYGERIHVLETKFDILVDALLECLPEGDGKEREVRQTIMQKLR